MSARWFYRLFVGLFFLAAGTNLALAQVNVNAKLNTQEILIGDQVRLTVQISLPTDLKFKAVKIKEALQAVPKIELLQKGTLLTVAQSPQQILEQQYLLSSYEAGTYQIPAITVDYEEGGLSLIHI